MGKKIKKNLSSLIKNVSSDKLKSTKRVIGGCLLIICLTHSIFANNPPGAFSLLTPASGETVTTEPGFSWTASSDPDGDPVTYKIDINIQSNGQLVHEKSGIGMVME
jgi:hypothetical protein